MRKKERSAGKRAEKAPERLEDGGLPDVVGEVRIVPIDSIAPHPENARKGDVEMIKRSILANGFYGMVLVWAERNQIVFGSHRWKAMRELGRPTIRAEFVSLTERHARRILAADNRTSDSASYDDRVLAVLLQNLADNQDLEAAMYAQEDLDELVKSLAPPDPPKEFKALEPGGMQLLRTCPRCGMQF